MKATEVLEPRPCERQCKRCRQWLHHSRFRTQTRQSSRHSTVSTFRPICKACEQIERNEKKNKDRALAIIKGRASNAAAKVGESLKFFWIQMNWRALVKPFAALMDGGLCQCCGHPFLNERDIQIEHIDPPRDSEDYANHHARNLRFACGSCNRTKGDKPFTQWKEEQEAARLSNLTCPVVVEPIKKPKTWLASPDHPILWQEDS